jgi:hypothetical protein
VLDQAGDFAALTDVVMRMLAPRASVRRIYYDLAPEREVIGGYAAPVPVPGKPGLYQTAGRSVSEPWRMRSVPLTTPPVALNSLVISALSGGVGLVAYNGHSNHWQFAITEHLPDGSDGRWLLNVNDVRLLANQNRPFVMLSMTCYTSQFVKPASNGTLDELLLRRKDAGAVAAWGPTGLSVVSGHELLQEGFLAQMQARPSGQQRLGELLAGGYSKVLEEGGALDPLMTFVLLGDPLTRARIGGNELFMPTVRR